MSDQHGRFSTWLRGPRSAEPPRDAALHATYCPDCRRSIAALDALAAVDLGAAPLPPMGGAAALTEPVPFEPPVRWMLGLLAAATLVLVAAIVIPGALRSAGDGGFSWNPKANLEGGVLGGVGTPSPRPSGDATETPSSIVLLGGKIPSTLEGEIVAPASPSPTDGPPAPFGPTDIPFASVFPFPSFPFLPSPTPTGQATFSSSASASASASASPTSDPTTTSAPTGTPTIQPTATPVPTVTAQPTATPIPTVPPPPTPTPTPAPTISPFDSASCFDGVDNDGDGATDGADLGCVASDVLPLGEGYF